MNPHGKHHRPGRMPLPVTSRQPPSGTHQQGATMPISMPGRPRSPIAPPALPPPRFADDPTVTVMESRPLNFPDPRRPWENGEFVGRRDESWDSKEDERFHRNPDFRRRQRETDPSWSPKDSLPSFAWKVDEGYHSMLSISTQLHGERQLHHRGQEKSSQAYDNKLLSKIGKPKTPPGHRSFASAESSPTSSLSFGRQPFPPQPRSLSFPNSATSGYSDSPIKIEPGLGFADSPQSRPVSPGTYSPFSNGGGRNFTEYRSPTQEHSTRSSTLDSDSYSPYHQRFPRSDGVVGGGSGGGNEASRTHQKGRRSIGQSSLSNVDESASLDFGKKTAKFHASLPSRSVKQENYEPIFSEPESTFRMEESVDQLHLDDRAFHHPVHRDSLPRQPGHVNHHLKSQRSMGGGTKRKAPPEASEASHDPSSQPSLQQMASTASHFAQQNPPSHLSPGFAQHHGSISSQSSAGFRNGSYASSGGGGGGGVPSVGGSSYTSLDHTSPGAISPSDPQHQYQQNMTQDTQYNHSLSMDPNSRAGPYPDPTQPPQLHDASFPESKPTPPRKEARKNNAPQTLSTSSFICECCPKKPRKFDTVEEKIQHEEEKQYRCMYCNNRFKNKNEAERHQNSLHLRRHSWSCAVLAQNYVAAFFSSTEVPNVNINSGQTEAVSAATDTCGYCGMEFTNDPAPDWDERTRHLDIVHKFRECNQSKKFFRADHFRQHLKHSHAGASGKWTNRLEQACIKEEPPATPLDQQTPDGNSTLTQSAPIANMGSTNQQDINQPSPTTINHAPTSHNNYSSHSNMIGQQNLAQMDMTNIDPSIGIQQLSELASVGDMSNPVPGLQQQQGQQQQAQQQQPPQQQSLSASVGGGGYEDMKHDSL